MTTFNYFDTLNRSALGFDRALKVLDEMATSSKKLQGYPPYNIRKINETEIMIELAVAGFTRNEIDIVLENGTISVKGTKNTEDGKNYLYKGIADRTFLHSYAIADTIVVKNASILNGILYILLENKIPEERKPKKIPISEVPEDAYVQQYAPELLLEKQAEELAERTAEKI